MDVVKCKGVTKNGSKCQYRPKVGCDGYCKRHWKPSSSECDKSAKPEEEKICSICQDNVDGRTDSGLSCKHPIHLDCAKQLHDDRCPICRMNITTKNSKLKGEELRNIRKKRKNDVREMEEDFTRQVIGEEDDDAEGMEIFNFIIPIQEALHQVDPPEIIEEQRPLVISWTVEMMATQGYEKVQSEDFHTFLHMETGIRNCQVLRNMVEEAVNIFYT